MYVKNLALLFCYIFLGINLSTAGRLNCYDTGNFTSNSTYGKNLDRILSSLPDNVSRNDGFFMTTVGQGFNQVYALALCRGDASSEDCSSCVSLRVREIKASCPNQTEAIVWEGDISCLVHYADRSIFRTLELQPCQAGYNVNNLIDFTSNVTKFYKKWNNLMDGLVERTSNGSSRLKFGTGIADVDSGKIYAEMQCTPDISQKDCKKCLRETVDQYQRCCQGRQGGYVQTPNCLFRWDLYSLFNYSAYTLYLPLLLPSPPPLPTPQSTTNRNISREDNGGLESQAVVIIVVPIIITIAIMGLACILLQKRKKTKQENIKNNNSFKTLLFDFCAIKVSTDNFSVNNKLGQGGFGIVYKGRLNDGQDIAVKRLSDNSVQGDLEFKNEVQLMAKLQHRNLVRLLGFSLEGRERLLIYEFLPTSSLNHYLFNEAMNPKIADFGLARLFSVDQTHDATKTQLEPCKYKSNLTVTNSSSFGLLVLEIIIGERISCFSSKEGEDLLNHAWRSWKTGTIMNMIDPTLRDGSRIKIMRCIYLGLLCVQANEASRPTMTSVELMLSSYSMPLPLPSRPGFVDSTLEPYQITVNETSISEMDPR